jgi:signal transduction histidine kinase
MLKIYPSSSAKQLMSGDAVQSMVHDFRTPITVIKGNLQLLLSGLMGQLSDEQLLLIQRSVGPLEEMILMTENLLQASSLGESAIILKLEEADLDQLVSDALEFYAAPFNQRHMKIYRDGNSFGTKLHIDASWMKRALNNLIWNAYKFTPDHGKVMIQIVHTEGGLELAVQDTGRGIPREKLSGIFDKFTQAFPKSDGKFGTGLGLWICKRVLELHGGSIRVESEPGKGSRFILSIPSSCIL